MALSVDSRACGQSGGPDPGRNDEFGEFGIVKVNHHESGMRMASDNTRTEATPASGHRSMEW